MDEMSITRRNTNITFKAIQTVTINILLLLIRPNIMLHEHGEENNLKLRFVTRKIERIIGVYSYFSY